jgi:hypothetical protein
LKRHCCRGLRVRRGYAAASAAAAGGASKFNLKFERTSSCRDSDEPPAGPGPEPARRARAPRAWKTRGSPAGPGLAGGRLELQAESDHDGRGLRVGGSGSRASMVVARADSGPRRPSAAAAALKFKLCSRWRSGGCRQWRAPGPPSSGVHGHRDGCSAGGRGGSRCPSES